MDCSFDPIGSFWIVLSYVAPNIEKIIYGAE
jgi:hypothetical protein